MFPNFGVSSGYGLPVPYTKPISTLTNGTQIHVSGTPTGNRFEVNLRDHQNNYVLHFNPRFDGNTIVLNTAQQGAWGQEDRHGLRFQRGVRFTLTITVTHSGFSISVNNSHVCDFHQRVPLHYAQVLEVKGDLQLESAEVYPASMGGTMNFPGMNVSFGGMPNPAGIGMNMGGFGMNMAFPSAPPAYPHASHHASHHVSHHAGHHVSGGVPSIQSCHIHTGSRIFVRGHIHPNAQRFELNLLQGYNDTDDIAFHFNPRFNQRQIVKNHRRNGQWGQEENQPFPAYMPLMPGAQIDLQITCNPDRYTVYMNNVLIAEFFHKIPPGAVMALQYKGDITVNSVGQL